jgi:hypothetical protein
LLPSKPGRACFIPTAFLGFVPPERSPPARWPTRFRDCRTRMPLALNDLPQANPRTGAQGPDFQALTLAGVPGRSRVFSPQLAGCSPGILPFQGSTTGRLARASTRRSPHALRLAAPEEHRHPGTTGSQSATDWPDSRIASEPTKRSHATLIGFPCLLDRADKRRVRPWLMDSPHGRPAVTDRHDPDLRTAIQRLDLSSAGSTLGT